MSSATVRGETWERLVVEEVQRQATTRGRKQITAYLDPQRDPTLLSLLGECGFQAVRRFITVEGDLQTAADRLLAACPRALRVPAIVERIVPFSPAFLSAAGQLCAEFLSEIPTPPGDVFYLAGDPDRFTLSQFLVVDDEVHGMVLVTREGDAAAFEAWVVRPRYRLRPAGSQFSRQSQPRRSVQ
jgi:hypothetical protein